MESNVFDKASDQLKKNKTKRRWKKVVSVLASIVVFCTTYALILPAITMEGTAYCGVEEHKHNEDCYKTELICELSGEQTEGHSHTADCYVQEKTLICTLQEDGHVHEDSCKEIKQNLICDLSETEEHVHGDACYESETTLICGLEEQEAHVHNEACWNTADILNCNQEESIQKEEHHHTEECYKKELNCEWEEHEHSLICYSNPKADVETAEIWEKTIPDTLTGIWADDVLAIAQSQLGYEESEKNYIVTEDGKTKGYTRYGDWYGDSYGHWCAMFVSFCLDYADVQGIPLNSNCQNWIETLSKEEYKLYHMTGEYEPKPGDLIFFDWDSIKEGQKRESDHIGLVVEVIPETDTSPAQMKTIEGNASDRVKYVTYDMEDDSILGYGELPKKKSHVAEYEGEDYRVTVSYSDEAKIPANVELIAEEILPETEEYHRYLQESLAAMDEAPGETEISFARFFDIHFMVEGVEVQPETPVDIQIIYKDAIEITEDENSSVVHFAEEGIEVLDSVASGENTDEENAVDTFAFTQGSFSVSGTVIYAVNAAAEEGNFTAKRINKDEIDGSGLYVLYTAVTTHWSTKYYAIQGTLEEGRANRTCTTANAVEIQVKEDGTISWDSEVGDSILWSLTPDGSNYIIQNAATQNYIHPCDVLLTNGGYAATLEAGSGTGIDQTFQIVRADAAANQTSRALYDTEKDVFASSYESKGKNDYDLDDANDFYIAELIQDSYYVWCDGTNGGIMGLNGSPDVVHNVLRGETFTLPDTWESPAKYDYTLRGWYDLVNHKYYAPGSEVEVTRNTVFYADWVATTYDIGEWNSSVSDTISTNDFITTRVFDYSTMFNMYSQDVLVAANAENHTETWSLITDGTVPYNDQSSLNFIFRDYDTFHKDISWPSNTNAANTDGNVYSGLYNEKLAAMLFGVDNSYNPSDNSGVMGKQYLGTADHLYHYGQNPDEEEHFGYYYYDSRFHAASYNQSDDRFYVYDYLERTTDSAKDKVSAGRYSDFLPFNSPYVNKNGKNVRTYSYDGEMGEYSSVDHYQYDAKYNTEDNSTDNVGANYWFGISSEIDFYLPNKPGTYDSEGNIGNQSIYGDHLVFEFSGDDDVWVLIDGELVLDIGGVHGIEAGKIDFSTGVVTVNDESVASVENLDQGRHILTFYYLERGSSQSNCKIRFNISPRYKLTIQKEDVLSQDLLNGAEFSVYTNLDCTDEAELWKSHADYLNDEEPTNTFVVENGRASMWGFSAGGTYYLKESKPPDNGYSLANGIVVMKLNNLGTSSYDVIEDPEIAARQTNPSPGFTVHGFRVNNVTQEAYLIVTNGKNITDVTSIQVEKQWDDEEDHSRTPVTVYLLADGVRIREITLSENNDWQYVWSNMPKYNADNEVINYTVQEGTVPGYIGRITKRDTLVNTETVWEENASNSFVNGETFLLQTENGCLSTSGNKLEWIQEEAAKTTPSAQWTATVSGNGVKLTNRAGKTLYYGTSTGTIASRFRVADNPRSGTSLAFNNGKIRSGSNYMGTLNNGVGSGTIYSNSALIFTLLQEVVHETTTSVEGFYYLITNVPAENVISLQVTKEWDVQSIGDSSIYEGLSVEVQLLADNRETNMTLTLSLHNNWTDVFEALPKYNESGEEIVYTVEEISISEEWTASYGDIVPIEGEENSFKTTITNTYHPAYELPETGGAGTIMYTMGGLLTMAVAGVSLLYKYMIKRRKEDRISF